MGMSESDLQITLLQEYLKLRTERKAYLQEKGLSRAEKLYRADEIRDEAAKRAHDKYFASQESK